MSNETNNHDEVEDILNQAPERLKEDGSDKYFKVEGHKISICAWCDTDKSLTKLARVKQDEIYSRLIAEYTSLYNKKARRVVSHTSCDDCQFELLKEFQEHLKRENMK